MNLSTRIAKYVENNRYYWRRLLFYFIPRYLNLFKKSKVFCISPWIQLHAQTNGYVVPCCMAYPSEETKVGNLKKDSDLLQSWNSEEMKQLRRNMLGGKESAVCTNCYRYEKLGKQSERMNYNQNYKTYTHRLFATEADGTLPLDEIPILDLRFSNKCNYKCRICSSEYSMLWYNEELIIGRLDGQLPKKEMQISADEPGFWRSFERQLHTVQRLHFAGGEPLYMDEHYKTLEKLIEFGNTDVTLSYNTNFSALKYKQYDLIDMWRQFKRVEVWASLDGMGAKGDYQRKGQNWLKIESNIREAQRKCANLYFGVNVTVSIFNVLDIIDFYKYMTENKFVDTDRMNLYLLFGPECFSIIQLPPELKQRSAALFDDFEKSYLPSVPKNEIIKNHLQSVRSYLFSEQGNLQAQLRKRILEVDALRGEKFTEVFPELRVLVEDEAYSTSLNS